MTRPPWPGGPLLNCRRNFDWLQYSGFVTGPRFETARWTETGSEFTAMPPVAVVFKASAGKHYTKRFVSGRNGPEQVTNGAQPYLHDIHLAWLKAPEVIAEVLTQLQPHSAFCIVRGACATGSGLHSVRRCQADRDPTDDPERPLVDCRRSWACLDFDDLIYSVPPSAWTQQPQAFRRGTTPEKDPIKAATALLDQTMPDEFRRAQMVLQLSASTGLKRLGPGLKCGIHLWVCLAEPLASYQMRAWANGQLDLTVNAEKAGEPIGFSPDPALFSANQVHYTAAPILPDGQEDISRVAPIILPDHMAEISGHSERPLAASVSIDQTDWTEYEKFGSGRMTVERRDALIRQIVTGASFYPAFMPLAKAMIWRGASLDDATREIRNLINQAPPSARRDARLESLETEIRRLADQVYRRKARQ